MAFPDDADLGTRMELQLGTAWTDITADTRLEQLITITRGRADESSQVAPSKVAAQIRNPDGRYSPRNPVGPYFGLLGRNTPARVSIAAGSPWLGLPASGPARVRASTPDAAVLDIVGDIDVRADVQPDDWNAANEVEVIGKWGGAGQRSWRLAILQGFVSFHWSADGTTDLSNAVPLGTNALTPRMCLRATLDVDNGASGKTVRFYVGPALSGPWTQLGTDQVSAGTTSIFNGTTALEAGDLTAGAFANAACRLYAAEVRNGLAGTVVANPDFTAQAVGATGFTDAAGRTYTVTAGGITNRSIRGIGEVPSWPPRWGTSGRLVKVGIEAAGIMRRLAQGASPLDSTLRRRITSWPTTVAYWPMEDGTGATQAYSPIAGVLPASVPGAQMASDDTLAGSLALPTWPAGSAFTCNVPPYAAATSWQVQCVFRINSTPASQTNVLVIQSSGTIRRWEIAIATGAFRVRGYDATATLTVDSPFSGADAAGPWTRLRFSAATAGGTVTWSLQLLPVGGNAGSATGTLSGTSGQVQDVHQSYLVAFDSLRLGHVAVFSDSNATAFDLADAGFDGEGAAVRYGRLATEESIPFVTPYGITGTALLGPQRADTVLNLLGESAAVDVGILYEPRDSIALALRPRRSLENQTVALTLDYADHQVAPPLEPEDDDQQTRNDVTRSRPAGSSARLTLGAGPLSTLPPPAGVGRYTDSQTVNVHSDGQLLHSAGWALHLGTYDGVRYPAVTIYLHRCPELIDQARAVDIGDRLQILGLPVWMPPGGADLIVQGVTEVIGVRTWTMTFLCTPAGPWTVGLLDDPGSRLTSAGTSTLASAVTDTATALLVGTATGPLWVPTAVRPGDFPLNVTLGGEVVTVGGITGAVEDSFTRTTSSSWGSATTGQAWTSTGGSAADFSTNGTTGRHSLTSVNVARVSTVGPAVADFDVVASVSTSALAAGASQFVYLLARFASTTDHLAARLEFTTTATVIISIRKRVAGTETQLSTTTTALTHVAGTLFRLRFQGAGSSLQAKAWLASGAEPDAWDTAVIDSSITAAGTVGVRSILNTGNTNTLPITAVCDNFALTNPQMFSPATRSVNGVTKSQSAGTQVEVAQPFILSL